MKTDNVIVLPLSDGVSMHEYTVKKNASLTLVVTAIASKMIDTTVVVRLMGTGAQATIIGIVAAADGADIKINTLQKHEAPETTSNLLVKSVLAADARCMVEGGIRVEKKAQKTDAYQRNENLLLSSDAYAESKPSLEILANDVRCTHGATVGPISEEEVWYLGTRGIDRVEAQRLIVEGFFAQALERVSDESVKYRILQSVQRVIV
jgi:Fe-S cluster assembly protein SufD